MRYNATRPRDAHSTRLGPPAAVVHIPKSAVLSARSCALAAHIPPAPYGHAAHLALAAAVLTEQ